MGLTKTRKTLGEKQFYTFSVFCENVELQTSVFPLSCAMSCTLRARWEKRPCMAAIPWRVGVSRWRPPRVFARCNAPLARSAPLLFCRTAVILSSRGGFAFQAHLLPMCLTSPAPPTVEGAGPRSLPPQGIRACSFFALRRSPPHPGHEKSAGSPTLKKWSRFSHVF